MQKWFLHTYKQIRSWRSSIQFDLLESFWTPQLNADAEFTAAIQLIGQLAANELGFDFDDTTLHVFSASILLNWATINLSSVHHACKVNVHNIPGILFRTSSKTFFISSLLNCKKMVTIIRNLLFEGRCPLTARMHMRMINWLICVEHIFRR